MPDRPTIAPAALSPRQAAEYCAISKAQLYILMEEGGFPRGFFISPRRRVILRSEIDAWLAERSISPRRPAGQAA